MIINFSVFKEKILDGTKKQTIRKYSEKRYKQFCNAKKYQLYWGNPRNGGTLLKEVKPVLIPMIISFDKNERLFDEEELAKADGFKNWNEMRDWFWDKYGKEMYFEKFMVIRWK